MSAADYVRGAIWCAATLPTDCPVGYGEVQRDFAIVFADHPKSCCHACHNRRRMEHPDQLGLFSHYR